MLDGNKELGELYARQGLVAEAKQTLGLVIDEYIKRNRIRDAGDVLREMAEIDPSDMKVRIRLAELYARDGNLEKAADQYVAIAEELVKKGHLAEALQLIEKALRSGPRSPRLLSAAARVYLVQKDFARAIEHLEEARRAAPADRDVSLRLAEACLGSKRPDDARKVLEALLQRDPSDEDARLQLGHVYLAEGRYDEAFEQVLPAVDKLVERRQIDRGAGILQQIVQRNPSHIRSLGKLVELYRQSRNDTLVAQTYSSMVEAYLAAGGLDQAASILEMLVQLEPHNDQHRSKLRWLREQQGGQPSGGFEMDFERAAGPLAPRELRAPARQERAGGPRAERPAVRRRRGVHQGAPRGGPRLPQVRPRRQGQGPVRGGAGPLPGQPRGPAGARRPPPREGRARDRGGAPARDGRGPPAQGRRPTRPRRSTPKPRARSRPPRPAVGPRRAPLARRRRAGSAPPGPEPRATDVGVEITIEEPAHEPEEMLEEFEDMEPVAPEPEPEPAFADDELAPAGDIGGQFIDEEEPEAAALGFDLEDALATAAPTVTTGLVAQPAPAAAPVGGVPPDLRRALDEIESYVSMGFVEDAKGVLGEVGDRFAGHPALVQRLAELGLEVAGAVRPGRRRLRPRGASEPVPPAPDAEEPLQLGSDFLEFTPTTSSAQVEIPTIEAAVACGAGRGRAPGGDGFDLASELGDLFGAQPAVAAQAPSAPGTDLGDASLADIFREFQKGVDKQLGKEDYETRYNLGIAYKEMGLVDEAIAEFQLAAKDEARLLECASMLGICFLEKGMPKLAVKWFEKGLSAPGRNEEEYQGLRYDLASALEQAGETERALALFTELYGQDASFRDVADKLRQLGDAP